MERHLRRELARLGCSLYVGASGTLIVTPDERRVLVASECPVRLLRVVLFDLVDGFSRPVRFPAAVLEVTVRDRRWADLDDAELHDELVFLVDVVLVVDGDRATTFAALADQDAPVPAVDAIAADGELVGFRYRTGIDLEDPDRLVNHQSAAQLVGVSPRRFRRLVEARRFCPPVRIDDVGHVRLWRERDVLRWAAANSALVAGDE